MLVTQESGLTRVFEVANVGGSWHISSQPVPVAHDSARGAVASFVIDKAGDELLADAQRLQLSQAYQGQALDASGAPASLWIVVTRTSASCYYNVDGPKIAEYVDERERFEKAVIVHQQGCAALIVQSRSCAMYTFSLPDLQQVSRMKFETTLQYVITVFDTPPRRPLTNQALAFTAEATLPESLPLRLTEISLNISTRSISASVPSAISTAPISRLRSTFSTRTSMCPSRPPPCNQSGLSLAPGSAGERCTRA